MQLYVLVVEPDKKLATMPSLDAVEQVSLNPHVVKLAGKLASRKPARIIMSFEIVQLLKNDGGNNDVVQEQINMDEAAKEAGVIVVPDCGLAPGMVSVMYPKDEKFLDS